MNRYKKRNIILIILAIVILILIIGTIYFINNNNDTNYNDKSSTGTIDENVKIGNLEISILEIKKVGNAYNISLKILNNYNIEKTINNINLKFIDKNGNIITEALAIVKQTIKSKEAAIISLDTDFNIESTYEIKYTIID